MRYVFERVAEDGEVLSRFTLSSDAFSPPAVDPAKLKDRKGEFRSPIMRAWLEFSEEERRCYQSEVPGDPTMSRFELPGFQAFYTGLAIDDLSQEVHIIVAQVGRANH